MSKSVPTVQRYMSTSPHTIGRNQPLPMAQKMMAEYRVRHLPVLEGGELVGVLSERDCALILSLRATDPAELKVEDAMSPIPYTCSPDARLDEVVTQMAEKKYGSAVVTQNGKVVGIFTAVDALTAFGELLHSRLK